MRSDHCWSQGRGRPSASFQAGKLHGAGAGILRQHDGQHLEQDAIDIVLRLLLGEAQRVHLHAIAEAAQLLILDAIALAADFVPQFGEGPHLADFGDEADAGIDEEGDAPDDLREFTRGD